MKGHLGEKKNCSLEKKIEASILLKIVFYIVEIIQNWIYLEAIIKELSEFLKTVTAFQPKANKASEVLL